MDILFRITIKIEITNVMADARKWKGYDPGKHGVGLYLTYGVWLMQNRLIALTNNIEDREYYLLFVYGSKL